MEQTNWYDQIPDAEKVTGVSALADRPNRPASYGIGGLTAADLKKHFDKLSLLLFDKLNAVIGGIKGKDFAEHIQTSLENYVSLRDLIDALGNGKFASEVLKVEDNKTLQAALHEIAGDIATNFEDIAGLKQRAKFLEESDSAIRGELVEVDDTLLSIGDWQLATIGYVPRLSLNGEYTPLSDVIDKAQEYRNDQAPQVVVSGPAIFRVFEDGVYRVVERDVPPYTRISFDIGGSVKRGTAYMVGRTVEFEVVGDPSDNTIKIVRDASLEGIDEKVSEHQEELNYLGENSATDLSVEFLKEDELYDKEYTLRINLKNRYGDILSHRVIDLPLEMAFVGATLNDDGTKIIFELQNGETVTLPVDSIVGKFNIAQGTGNSTDAVMSQDATTKELTKKLDKLPSTLYPGNILVYMRGPNGESTYSILGSSVNGVNNARIAMYFARGSGTSVGNNGNSVLLTGDPAAPYDAANKKYVDESISGLGIDAVREDIVSVTKDVETLKEAAEGKLYDFKEIIDTQGDLYVRSDAFSGYMISLLGGYKGNFSNTKNIVLNIQLPYFVISKPENLSFSFDANDGTLVLNGTMNAGEEVLIGYSLEIDNYAYSSKIFYRGGTVETSGADPTIRFRITPSPVVGDEEFIVKTVIKNENTAGFSLTSSFMDKRIRSIVFEAPDGATFTNYKFNLAFCVGDEPETYEEPSFLKAIQSKPKAFFIKGKNRWNGDAEATGVKIIDFVAKSPIPAGDYTLFLDRYAEGAGGSRIEFNFSDGSVIAKTSSTGTYEFTAVEPLIGFKIYAKTNDKNSENVKLIVKNVMLIRKIPNTLNERPSKFIPYHDDITVEIPEYLRSLAGYGVAVNPYKYNKIDLEEMYYTNNCTLYTIDGSTNFEEIDVGLFAISDVPAFASASYYTSGLFSTRGEYEPFSIWYDDYGTEKLVVMMGEDTTLEELKATVAKYPFYLGVVGTETKYTLDAGEILAGNCEIYLPVAQGDTVTIIGEHGNPTNNATVGYIYQRKL